MPLILPGNVGSSTAATGYDVANSCRFNDGDSAYMHKTHSGGGTTTKGTYSGWIKKCTNSGQKILFMEYESSGNYMMITFETANTIRIYGENGGSELFYLKTNAVYRDPSAWMHIVVAFDSTQGTSTNRIKLYINGVQETSLSSTTYPSQDANLKFNQSGEIQYVGAYTGSSSFMDGYMAEICWIDGSALAPTSFGEFDSDSGIWKPIDVSGLTFGTNGFYLDFEDSANLGNDANGGTDLTESGLAAIDQSTDTCTNNSATIGTLFMGLNTPTFSEGNLQSYSSAAGLAVIPSSMGLASGKWYVELKYAATTSNDNTGIGINMDPASSNQQNTEQGGYTFGYAASNGGYTPYQGDQSGSGATYTVDDIMGIYMDLDNMKLYFSKNGTLNSSTGLTINVSNTGFYYFCVQDYTNTSNYWTWQWNFGAGCPFAISSGNTDANGYGNFEYSPTITGDGASKNFYACNTKNLAEFG